ncbi:MAG: hypothetical protein UHD09_07125 [Bifidobacterium sp.]|nr:hypothetical protein [Bifidobacterium sp.]
MDEDDEFVDLELVNLYRDTLEAHVRPNPDVAWLVHADAERILSDGGTLVCTLMRAERVRRDGAAHWRTTAVTSVELTPAQLDKGHWILAAREAWPDDLTSTGPAAVSSDDPLMWRDWRWSVQSGDWVDSSIDMDDEYGMIGWALLSDPDTGWLYAHLVWFDASLDRWRTEWSTPLPVDRDRWLAEAKMAYETSWQQAFDDAESRGLTGLTC